MISREKIESLGWIKVEPDSEEDDFDLYFYNFSSDKRQVKYSMEVRDDHYLICRGYSAYQGVAMNVRFNGRIDRLEELALVMKMVNVDKQVFKKLIT